MITTWQLLAWRYHWPLTGALALCIPTCDKTSKLTNQATNQKRKKTSRYEHTHTHPGKAGPTLKTQGEQKQNRHPKSKTDDFCKFFLFAIVFPSFSISFP
jgi:hypothetical protein